MKKLLLIVISFFICTNLFAQGQIINVPDDQPTIQAAINASVDGDTVLVADGTYYENINYKGKAITVASWFLIDGDETHIDSTIINGSQPTKPDSASVVSFVSGEDTTSVLYGFTITGGKGGNPPEATHDAWGGGGIAITNSGAKIIYNKIVFNTVTTDNGYGYGGGILVAFTSQPIQIIKNIIANNKIIGIGENENGGGGIFCAYVNGSELIIADNIIANHFLTSNSFGGAIQFAHFGGKPDIRNNLIINNVAKFSGGLHFVDYTSEENINLINNTIVNNHATEKEGAINHLGSGPLSIANSILWGNRAPNNPQIYGDVFVKYSNVEGGYTGTGNINQEPLFADTTLFYLTASSPCVDAGNPEGFFYDLSDPNNPCFPLFPAMGGLRNDMGTYGGNPYMIYAQVPSYFIRNYSLNNTYQVPGTDTLIITSEIFSPENQIVEVQAFIKSIDKAINDSIPIVDNGVYPDNITGDGIYSGFWSVPNSEEDYNIDVSAYLSDYEYLVFLENAVSFTTKGPVKINNVEFLSDSVVGSRITFNLTLENLGITDSLNDITIDFIIPENARYKNASTGSSTFGDIAPGESKQCSRFYGIVFDDSCRTNSPYEIKVAIKSKEMVFWYDTLKINLIPTDIENEPSNLPKEYALEQNYPNPFNPSTTIKYSIPIVETGHAPSVRLIVYDVLGREVATLVNQQQKAGCYEVNWNASTNSSGIYFYKLNAGTFMETKKMILLR